MEAKTVETTTEMVTLKTFNDSQKVYLNGQEKGSIRVRVQWDRSRLVEKHEAIPSVGIPKLFDKVPDAMWYLAGT